MNEPTIDDIDVAWTDCINHNCKLGTFQTLIDLRNKKYTWLGKKEVDFMFAIDRYISNLGVYNETDY